MGKIEEYWSDIKVYSVEFLTDSNVNGKHPRRKTLVFSSEITKEDVFELVPVYFNHIEKVLYVDELTDGLLLKEQSLYKK